LVCTEITRQIGVRESFCFLGPLWSWVGRFEWMVVGTEEFSITLIMPLKKTRQGRVLFLDTRIEVCFGLIFSFSHSFVRRILLVSPLAVTSW